MSCSTQSAETIFGRAIEIANTDQRAAYLAEACGSDRNLRGQIEVLVADYFRAANFLERPALVAETCASEPLVESIGQQIGPYKLRELLGEGGMGVVYVAEQDEPIRRKVALKIIKPGMDSRDVLARFNAERQVLALLDHPNIAKIIDAGTTGEVRSAEFGMRSENDASAAIPHSALRTPHLPSAGRPYFVMELVRGVPITEFCDQQKLATPDRLELFIQVCRAIQHAHQKGVIHRDIKPSNVLVTLHDDQPVPKVIDFGIAKATGGSVCGAGVSPAIPTRSVSEGFSDLARSASEGSGEGQSIYTGFAQMIGTPLYMSPEQAEMNALDVDTRSDVYSLGVLLYELLTGSTPFDKDRLKSASFDEMRRIIREEEPETVSNRIARTRRVGQGCDSSRRPTDQYLNPKSKIQNPKSSELDWIVMKSLEKNRTRRYESASAFAADIQLYLSDEPVLACPPTTMYRFQKFAKKHQPAVAAVAAIALCLLLGITVSAWQAVRASAAEAQATANKLMAVANEAHAKEAAAAEAKQRQRAEANEQKANAQRDEVKTVNDQLQRTLYASNMNLAKNA